jgi:hypothetical protein
VVTRTSGSEGGGEETIGPKASTGARRRPYYNPRRLHSTLGYHSPADHEQKHTLTEGEADQPPLAQ